MLLLSIHPKHVDAILGQTKQIELRRRKPRIDAGDGLIYATAPRMELVANFRIASVCRAPLDLLWQSVRDVAGVTRKEFNAYFAGLEFGVAIGMAEIREFRVPVQLHELRAAWKGFHPPQGFRYMDRSEVAKLGINELRPAA